jgi:hypothetical protein
MAANYAERKRSTLFQILVLLVVLAQGIIAYAAIHQMEISLTPYLAVFSLLACLFVMVDERRLKRR